MTRDTVLVTGASGWLGARLRLTLRGELTEFVAPDPIERIRLLVEPGAAAPGDATASEGGPREERVEGDLRSAADLERFCADARGAVLYHCAGIIHPRLRVRELSDVNVEGTRGLLAAAEAAGVRRCVVMSSNSPFGANASAEERFDEDAPYAPYMAYGRSKMQVERIAFEANARGRMQTVIARAPWFYGPGQPPRQSEFFRMIRRGVAPLVGGGRNMRSMTYVDELAAGLVRCAQVPDAAGRAYWFGDARPYATHEIISTVARVLEDDFGLACRPQRLRLPGWAADVARVVDRGLQAAGFYEQRVHVLSEMNLHIACNVERAERELGHTPHIGLEEGMRRSIQWCLDAGITL